MKIVLQRVSNASVSVSGKIVGEIGKGYLILLGVGKEDDGSDIEKLVLKIVNLRIFSDENDKINLSLRDVEGDILVVSQFTLYADCRKGNRPNFTLAGSPDLAKSVYERFIAECKKYVPKVEQGIFGEDMQVSLINDGPFTIVI